MNNTKPKQPYKKTTKLYVRTEPNETKLWIN